MSRGHYDILGIQLPCRCAMDAVAVPSSFIIEETSAPKPFSISSVWFLDRAGSVTEVEESA